MRDMLRRHNLIVKKHSYLRETNLGKSAVRFLA